MKYLLSCLVASAVLAGCDIFVYEEEQSPEHIVLKEDVGNTYAEFTVIIPHNPTLSYAYDVNRYYKRAYADKKYLRLHIYSDKEAAMLDIGAPLEEWEKIVERYLLDYHHNRDRYIEEIDFYPLEQPIVNLTSDDGNDMDKEE